MKIRAEVNFAGKISMFKGQEADVSDKEALNDLLEAGYVTALEEPEAERQKKKGRKKAEADESQ